MAAWTVLGVDPGIRDIVFVPPPTRFVLGDMNLDFDRPAITQALESMSAVAAEDPSAAHFCFPFLGAHPDRSEVVRTNARRTETFDQIVVIRRDPRLPGPEATATAGTEQDGFDHGVFDFVDLISNALERRPFAKLPRRARRRLLAHFEHDLTDHMPIWVRPHHPASNELRATSSHPARNLPSSLGPARSLPACGARNPV